MWQPRRPWLGQAAAAPPGPPPLPDPPISHIARNHSHSPPSISESEIGRRWGGRPGRDLNRTEGNTERPTGR
jgi:hypothetical protein